MKYKLDQEEKEILDAFQRDKLKSVPHVVQEIEEARQAARNTFNKTKRVNLRLTERDFHMAHVRALEEGLPYQTLLSSVIHKYLTGRLIDKT
jgi:predicted DNA binding CopG/RHH family protein